jgi:hypothetical protein
VIIKTATNSKPGDNMNENSKQKSKLQIEKYEKELRQLYQDAENNKIPKVVFTFAGTNRKYTPINRFFDGPIEF